ncbi:hypothetical protein LTR08_001401 [Meristemomyces frigidus]|nr:hypothetical protein LTR08_001401 [Meristemomyces frigidus]
MLHPANTVGALLLLASLAESASYLQITGSGQAPFEDAVLLEQAGRTPNSTSSVQFSPHFSGDAASEGSWVWSVNITNVAVPNATVPESGQSPPITLDPHVAFTQYDLGWSGNTSLNGELAASSNAAALCLTTIVGDIPQSVASNYSQSDNGDCTSTLGSECIASLLNSMEPLQAGDCPAPSFGNLKGCEGSLSAAGYMFTSALGNASNASNATAGDYTKRNGFAYTLSNALPATNLTNYVHAQDMLQMLVLTAVTGSELTISTIMCQRVSERGVSGNTTTTADPSSISASPSSTASSAAVAGVERVAGLGAMGLVGFAVAFSLM